MKEVGQQFIVDVISMKIYNFLRKIKKSKKRLLREQTFTHGRLVKMGDGSVPVRPSVKKNARWGREFGKTNSSTMSALGSGREKLGLKLFELLFFLD